MQTVGVVAILLLVASGCTTTTSGRPGSIAARAWLAGHASSNVDVVAEGGVDRTSVLIEASSPTEVHFKTRESVVIPVERIQRVVLVRRGRGALEGAGIGAGAGALFGAVFGLTRTLSPYESSMDCTIICSHDDAAKLSAVVFGLFGLLIGAATGAVIGDRDVLDLR